MPFLFGADTQTIVLKSESHKLHEEFEVEAGQTVLKGQPVIIVDDGTIQAAPVTGSPQTTIGFTLHDGVAGDLVTVMLRGYAILFAQCETNALVAGPVHLGAASVYNVVDGYVYVDDAAVDETTHLGWVIEGGDIDDIVRLIVL